MPKTPSCRLCNQEIDPEDHATLDALAPNIQGEAGSGRTLADIIFSKMEGGAVTRGIEEEGTQWRTEKVS